MDRSERTLKVEKENVKRNGVEETPERRGKNKEEERAKGRWKRLEQRKTRTYARTPNTRFLPQADLTYICGGKIVNVEGK